MSYSPTPCNDRCSTVRGLALSILTLWLAGCSAMQPVRVLPEGTTAITGSLGGPVGIAASPLGFVPYTTVGVAHGLSEAVTVHGNAHLLMAAFGVVGLDAGASFRLLRQDGTMPEVTASVGGLLFSDVVNTSGTRLYPNASVNLSWDLGRAWLGYVGTHTTLQPSDTRLYVSPMMGVVMPLSSAWSLQLETIWQAANVDTRKGIFEGQSSISGAGSFGVFIGAQVKL